MKSQMALDDLTQGCGEELAQVKNWEWQAAGGD